MSFSRIVTLSLTHTATWVVGFAAGIYALPLLTAPPPPMVEVIAESNKTQRFIGEFDRDRKDSDQLHWGEGKFSINDNDITFIGELAPGPNYKLYLSPTFIETEADFLQQKAQLKLVGNVNTFENFVVSLDQSINPAEFDTVIIWCESFDQFITSGRYNPQ